MKIKLFHIIVLLLFQLVLHCGPLFAVETAPRIKDREIIEKLATLEAGQAAMNKRFDDINKRFDDTNKRFDDINKRIDNLTNTMLALFGAIVTLIIALFAYIAWDRRTMVKPVMNQVNQMERDLVTHLDLYNTQGSLLQRQLMALRAYARKNPEFAEIMRSVSLL
ncbi:MAG: hypothetical protein R6U68_14135 [Desulfobacteraceae bacterium]